MRTLNTPEHQVHTIGPFFDSSSEILVVGSFPSPKSRESGFFYGHPSNRFWKILSSAGGYPVPGSVEDKKELLSAMKTALWDIVASCTITGASDSSIRDVEYNDLNMLISQSSVRTVIFNGGTSYSLFLSSGITFPGYVKILKLPSTSAANASFSLEKLKEAWSEAFADHSSRS
ncbi:MAG: DNA-deoxyinosine glycosylase [Oscillospiraceae bacterium]|nr:DNA-deoxyinosine glycosylase [Oscillospiraceae bacterium]